MPGWTSEPTGFYRLLDVFALTSHSEGASVSLMEAMSCGITPVVMDVGANAETLGPELQTQLVRAGDVDGFREAVVRTLKGNLAHLGALARRHAEQRYSLDRMMNAYEQIYRN
jgi:glycosyltransferase involved in cell wall biosynthesis